MCGTTLNRVSETSEPRTRFCDGYIRFSGDLDVATVSECAAEAIKAVRSARDVVTVDVSDVARTDTAGVGLLADVLALSTSRGHAVTLHGASARLHEQLLLRGIESLFSYR